MYGWGHLWPGSQAAPSFHPPGARASPHIKCRQVINVGPLCEILKWAPYTNVYWEMYQSPRAAVTKDHRLGVLKHRHSSSHSSGGWKSEIEVSAGPCSSGALGGPLLCLFLASVVAAHPWNPMACSCITPGSASVITCCSPFIRTLGILVQGPP